MISRVWSGGMAAGVRETRVLIRRARVLAREYKRDAEGQFASGGGGYTEIYGEVLDEGFAGGDGEYVVAVTATGDMHIAFDDPEGTGTVADREVLAEIDPDGARSLADELRWAADYDHSEDVPNDEGIVDSVGVVGAEHLEVWVHQTGDVGIRNVDEDELPGWDLGNEDAADFADALDEMADFYDGVFG